MGPSPSLLQRVRLIYSTVRRSYIHLLIYIFEILSFFLILLLKDFKLVFSLSSIFYLGPQIGNKVSERMFPMFPTLLNLCISKSALRSLQRCSFCLNNSVLCGGDRMSCSRLLHQVGSLARQSNSL